MEDRLIMKWQAREGVFKPKGNSWYISIAIAAGGLAIAAILIANYLFALIAVLGGFALMVVGSKKPSRLTYALYEHHFGIGSDIIPFEKIMRFAIKEDEPRHLTLEMRTLVGYVDIPLLDADHRKIRMALKNHDIEEVEKLDTFVTHTVKWMGL